MTDTIKLQWTGDLKLGDYCIEAALWGDFADKLKPHGIKLLIPSQVAEWIRYKELSDNIGVWNESDVATWELEPEHDARPTVLYPDNIVLAEPSCRPTVITRWQMVYEKLFKHLTGEDSNIQIRNVKCDTPEQFNVLLHSNRAEWGKLCSSKCLSKENYARFILKLHKIRPINKLYLTVHGTNAKEVEYLQRVLSPRLAVELVELPLSDLWDFIKNNVNTTVTHSTGILHLSGLLDRHTICIDNNEHEAGEYEEGFGWNTMYWLPPNMSKAVQFGKSIGCHFDLDKLAFHSIDQREKGTMAEIAIDMENGEEIERCVERYVSECLDIVSKPITVNEVVQRCYYVPAITE